MGFRIVVLSFLIIFFGAVFVPAAQHRTPVVLILLRSSTGTETRSFRVLIVDAITVEMASRDIDAVSTNDGFTEDSQVLSIAEGRKADFAVSGAYTLAGGSVELHLRWFDLRQKKAFPDASLSAPLDLKFDSVLAGFVGQILDDHKQELVSLPPSPLHRRPPRSQPRRPSVLLRP